MNADLEDTHWPAVTGEVERGLMKKPQLPLQRLALGVDLDAMSTRYGCGGKKVVDGMGGYAETPSGFVWRGDQNGTNFADGLW